MKCDVTEYSTYIHMFALHASYFPGAITVLTVHISQGHCNHIHVRTYTYTYIYTYTASYFLIGDNNNSNINLFGAVKNLFCIYIYIYIPSMQGIVEAGLD